MREVNFFNTERGRWTQQRKIVSFLCTVNIYDKEDISKYDRNIVYTLEFQIRLCRLLKVQNIFKDDAEF
jgi:hypothetical protein